MANQNRALQRAVQHAPLASTADAAIVALPAQVAHDYVPHEAFVTSKRISAPDPTNMTAAIQTYDRSAESVRTHLSRLTCAQFRDLSRRLVLYATRLLRGASLDHHAYEVVSGAVHRALDGRRRWDPLAYSFETFLFGVVRSRASALRRSPAACTIRIAAQLPPDAESSLDLLADRADANPNADTLPSIEAEQEREHLVQNVARIDAALAQVFVMAFYEGRSNLDIAARMSMSIRDVENGKKRLRRVLKRALLDGSH